MQHRLEVPSVFMFFFKRIGYSLTQADRLYQASDTSLVMMHEHAAPGLRGRPSAWMSSPEATPILFELLLGLFGAEAGQFPYWPVYLSTDLSICLYIHPSDPSIYQDVYNIYIYIY